MDQSNTNQFGGKDELFRLLVDCVRDYAIFALDSSGIVISWNAGAEHIKGYQAAEIVGHHFSRFYPPAAIRSGWPQTELTLAAQQGRFEDEGWRVRKDGSQFWANVVLTAIRNEAGVLQGFAKVTRDLTEQKRVESLEADAKVMGEFVAMLAHELRNPLAPIRNAAKIGMHVAADAEKAAWAFEIIDRQSRHMAKLVDDLLDVSRVSHGLVRLKRRRMTMGEVLDTSLEAVRSMYDAKQQTLIVERSANPVVRGDELRLVQVLSNLLNNASKYTQIGGRIEVRLDEAGDQAVISVADSGIGIPEDVLPRVFDLFTQDKRTLDRSEGGLGLGLAITKKLVEMHGGEVHASSPGRGCGSLFTLKLPLFRAGSNVVDDALSVLVIEDNRDAADALQILIQIEGLACEVAYDGPTGLQRAKELMPDVILLDIGLPGMDGYEVVREIRRIGDLDGITIAAVTGYSSENDQRRAKEAGFDYFFSKPITFEEIVRAMPMLQSGIGR